MPRKVVQQQLGLGALIFWCVVLLVILIEPQILPELATGLASLVGPLLVLALESLFAAF